MLDKLDAFDEILKEKAHKDSCKLPELLDKKIDTILVALPDKKSYRKPTLKIALIAATVATLCLTSILASGTPAVRDMVNSAISYFHNTTDTRYITDKTNLEKFNKAIGVSAEDNGIKLTVDNIATDDNFMNVFYTIESKNPIKTAADDKNIGFDALFSSPFLEFKLNGKRIETSNHNDKDAYFENDRVLKVMDRFNVSQSNLPQSFNLQISTEEIFKTKGKWILATTVDKSEVAVATKTVKPNLKANIDLGDFKHTITIDKVSISPFGSQIVISEKVKDDKVFDKFALLDDNGTVLDVLNTDEHVSGLGKTTNSFEFTKANTHMKNITLIPIKFAETGKDAVIEKQSINKLPITFKTCNTGSRVIDKIEFNKNVARISYHNEGVDLWNPAFLFYDANDKELTFGDGDCGLQTSVDRQKGEYTQILTFANKNIDFSKIAKIGTFTDVNHFELLKDQGIKINLEP